VRHFLGVLMKKICYFGILLVVVFPACTASKIKSNRYYRDSKLGWPTLILYKDSIFSFNYIAPNKFDYSGPSLFPQKYFTTKGRWKLKQGIITLTSSSDSLAHAIESSHPTINPFIRNSTDPSFSTFVFNDPWGDTVEVNQVLIDNKPLVGSLDTLIKAYSIDLTANSDILTFYFKHYEPYIFRNFEKINKRYDIELQPTYSSVFFENDSFTVTRNKLIDIKRKLKLERLR
jgi:hypothetical protein